MNWVGWVAIIGAAAWLPQITLFIYNLYVKPKLQFIPESTIQLGYTYLGPILNVSFVISTSRKDALLEKIKLAVIHKTGEKHEFNWHFLEERGFEGTSSTGERVEM